MRIVNPNCELEDRNIFIIRKEEYNEIFDIIDKSLDPVRELGYEIDKFGIVNSRLYSEELSKTFRKKLEIILKKDEVKIDISMSIPELIDDNFIFINGKKKVPHFQLLDLPIISKENNKMNFRSCIVKFRSNVLTAVLYEKGNNFPKITVSILGKRIPFALLVMCYYGKEKINKIFNMDHYLTEDGLGSLPNLCWHMYGRLLYEIKEYYIQDLDHDEYLRILGSYFTKFNPRDKGEDILYILDLIPKIDIITKKFMRKESVIDEIIWGIQYGPFDDADLRFKRIRCFEYLILGPVFRSIFNLCILVKDSKNPKFNVNKSEIIQHCNVSDIVQFDFSINPVGSLTELSRISLLGPGGFSRNKVPKYLRDIHESMFGRICVVDTPDRDNCGVVENLLPNSKLDKDLRFNNDICEKSPISIPVSMVPFLEHDDQTRLQMSSSQMRQAILLQTPEPPLIRSGCENLYTHYTPFMLIAKEDGVVIFDDPNDDLIIVRYDNGQIDLFDAGVRKIYVHNMDTMHHSIKEGDKFKKGDILAESLFVNDGSINIGRNLLTGVTIYRGYNYEDGITISDKLVHDQILASVHYKDLSFYVPPNKILLNLCDRNIVDEDDEDFGDTSGYTIITTHSEGEKKINKKFKPLPKREDIIEAGNPYAIMKKIPVKSDDFSTIFEEKEELISNKKLVILGYSIYVNDYLDETRIPEEYKNWIRVRSEAQRKREEKIRDIIIGNTTKKDAVKFNKTYFNNFESDGRYKNKGERFDGIFVDLKAYYIRQIEIGDKIGNRHGNKGVISRILSEDQMPRLPDGRTLDIIINPLGIISRMNIGQLFELHLSMSLNDFKNKLKSMIPQESQEDIKKYIMKYIRIIDNTKDGWYQKQFGEQLKTIDIDEEFIDKLFLIQPPFESINMKKCRKALRYTNTPFKYELFDPVIETVDDDGNIEYGDYLINKIACGYMYFFRMAHIAEEKLAARGIGSYTKKTLQPTSGKRNQGGQRLGEMEVACMIAHDSTHNLHESMTTKSDCIEAKNRWMYQTIDSGNTLKNNQFDDSDDVSESVRLLNSYLTIIGIDKD